MANTRKTFKIGDEVLVRGWPDNEVLSEPFEKQGVKYIKVLSTNGLGDKEVNEVKLSDVSYPGSVILAQAIGNMFETKDDTIKKLKKQVEKLKYEIKKLRKG